MEHENRSEILEKLAEKEPVPDWLRKNLLLLAAHTDLLTPQVKQEPAPALFIYTH